MKTTINFNINDPVNKLKLIKLDMEIRNEEAQVQRYLQLRDHVKVDNKKEMLEAMAEKLKLQGIIIE